MGDAVVSGQADETLQRVQGLVRRAVREGDARNGELMIWRELPSLTETYLDAYADTAETLNRVHVTSEAGVKFKRLCRWLLLWWRSELIAFRKEVDESAGAPLWEAVSRFYRRQTDFAEELEAKGKELFAGLPAHERAAIAKAADELSGE